MLMKNTWMLRWDHVRKGTRSKLTLKESESPTHTSVLRHEFRGRPHFYQVSLFIPVIVRKWFRHYHLPISTIGNAVEVIVAS